MSVHVCLDLACDESLIFAHVGDALRRDGAVVTGLTLGRRWTEAWRDGFWLRPMDMPEKRAVDHSELERIAREYPEETVSDFLLGDRFICELHRAEQQRLLIHTFQLIERLVTEDGVDVFLLTGVAYMYHRVILAVCRRHGRRAVSLYTARLAESRFTYSLSEGGVWDPVLARYRQLKAEDAPARTHLDSVRSFRSRAEQPDYMKSARQRGGLKWVFVREFLRRCRQWYLQGWSKRSDYLTQHPLWYARRDLVRLARVRMGVGRSMFEDPQPGVRYVLFPLHLQPEASTLILGRGFVDQAALIEQMARALPPDMELLVKEHPAAYGRRPRSVYRRMRRCFNVRIVAPEWPVQPLIAGADAVVVISGTMGWEALLMGTPAAVLGRVYYESFDGVHQLDGPDGLGDLVRDGRPAGTTEDQAAIALQAVHEGSFPGRFDVHKLDTAGDVLSSANLNAVEEGVRAILRDLAVSKEEGVS